MSCNSKLPTSSVQQQQHWLMFLLCYRWQNLRRGHEQQPACGRKRTHTRPLQEHRRGHVQLQWGVRGEGQPLLPLWKSHADGLGQGPAWTASRLRGAVWLRSLDWRCPGTTERMVIQKSWAPKKHNISFHSFLLNNNASFSITKYLCFRKYFLWAFVFLCD